MHERVADDEAVGADLVGVALKVLVAELAAGQAHVLPLAQPALTDLGGRQLLGVGDDLAPPLFGGEHLS